MDEQLAIERGIEFFYEVIFYAIIFSIPLMEIIRVANEKKTSRAKFDSKSGRLYNEI